MAPYTRRLLSATSVFRLDAAAAASAGPSIDRCSSPRRYFVPGPRKPPFYAA
jgi:hypothetical protein